MKLEGDHFKGEKKQHLVPVLDSADHCDLPYAVHCEGNTTVLAMTQTCLLVKPRDEDTHLSSV